MEENSLNNLIGTAGTITDSFKKLKFVVVACLVITLVTALGSVIYSSYSIRQVTDKVYVIDKGQAFAATRQDQGLTRREEIAVQADRMHGLFFNVSSNMTVVKANLEKALKLFGDNSLYTYYNDLQAADFYQRTAQIPANQEIIVDKVDINMDTYPYQVEVHASLFYTRPTLVTKSELVTTCCMRDVPRDFDNPQGLKIEKFKVVSNTEVEKRKRN